MMRHLTTLLEIVGVLMFLGGTLLIDWRVAVALTGFLLVALGFVLAAPREGGP